MPGQKLDSMILVGPFQVRLSYISIKYSVQFSLRYLELLKLWGFFSNFSLCWFQNHFEFQI